MKKRFLFSVLLLKVFLINVVIAQNNQTYTNYQQAIIPPSPNASSLAKYIDYPVSLSTGVPDISIPIYTLASKKLSVPISISYHAGGVKVSDKAFNMGVGWTLNSGGAISRVMKDIPDETQYGFFNMVFPDENNGGVTYQKDYCLANHFIDSYTDGAVKYDGEPDMFFYNFGGLGGSFLFRNRTAVGVDPQPVTIPYSPIKISWNNQYFQTTDLEGNTYTFGDVTGARDNTIYGDKPMNLYNGVINAWYLTKIVSADKTETVTFSYEANPSTSSANAITATGNLKYPQISSDPNATTTTISYSGSNNTENTVRLKEIICTNGKVDFTYTNDRLSNIDIYKNENGNYSEIKAFKVLQSAFDRINESSFSYGLNYSGISRTRLDAIQEVSYVNNAPSIANPAYKFSYYSTDLPDVNSKSQDMWGLYNASGNTDMLFVKVAPTGSGTNTTFVAAQEKRSVDTAMAKKGSLKRIDYPTGGYANFVLESNQIYTNVTSTTTTTTPQSVAFNISTFKMLPNDQTTGVTTTFTPDPNISGSVKLDFSGVSQCSPSSTCISNIPEVILYDLTTNTRIDDILLTNLYHNTSTSQSSSTSYALTIGHQYKLYFPTPGMLTNSSQTTQYRLSATLTEPLPSTTTTQTTTNPTPTTVFAGGLRVKQIVQNDGRGNTIIKNYNYVKPYFNSQIFQGDFSYMMDNLARDKYIYVTSSGIASWFKNSRTYSEGLSVPIGGTANSSVSYEQVEEVISGVDGRNLGKTLYTFNTAQDYISNQYPTFRIGNDYIRNQVKSTKSYKVDNAGNYTLIKEVTNSYNNINQTQGDDPSGDNVKFYQAFMDIDYAYYQAQVNGAPLPNATYNLSSIPLTTVGCKIYPNNLNGKYHISPFYYHVVRPLLTSTTTTTYDGNGQNSITSETDYAYDNLTHIQPTRTTTTNSDQKVKVQTIKYPLDFNYNANCSLDACVTNFNQQLASLKSQREQCQQSALNSNSNAQPNHDNAISAFDNCESTYNTAVATLVSQYTSCVSQYQQCYANAENSLASPDKAIAYMQDKNMITPKVDEITTVNGSQTERVKTDFALGVNNLDLIHPSQVNVQVASNAIQPRATFGYDDAGNLHEQEEVGGPPTSYIWSYNKQYPVIVVKNATYAAVESALGGASAVSSFAASTPTQAQLNSMAATLRTDLPQAQVTTYTYSTLIGMTSMTDAKGMTTYYEYDGFQRLMNIKDKDGNILKHMDYHYQGQ